VHEIARLSRKRQTLKRVRLMSRSRCPGKSRYSFSSHDVESVCYQSSVVVSSRWWSYMQLPYLQSNIICAPLTRATSCVPLQRGSLVISRIVFLKNDRSTNAHRMVVVKLDGVKFSLVNNFSIHESIHPYGRELEFGPSAICLVAKVRMLRDHAACKGLYMQV
jgi:hypothetical protein